MHTNGGWQGICVTPQQIPFWDVTKNTKNKTKGFYYLIKFSNFSLVVNILDSGKMCVSKIFATQFNGLLHSCLCIVFMYEK